MLYFIAFCASIFLAVHIQIFSNQGYSAEPCYEKIQIEGGKGCDLENVILNACVDRPIVLNLQSYSCLQESSPKQHQLILKLEWNGPPTSNVRFTRKQIKAVWLQPVIMDYIISKGNQKALLLQWGGPYDRRNYTAWEAHPYTPCGLEPNRPQVLWVPLKELFKEVEQQSQ